MEMMNVLINGNDEIRILSKNLKVGAQNGLLSKCLRSNILREIIIQVNLDMTDHCTTDFCI